MKQLSAYTIARYCTDTTDVMYGIEEIREKISQRNKANRRVPYYFYTRLSKLKIKLKKLKTVEINKNQKIMWEIIDDKGTVYSGDEDEMKSLFEEIIMGKVKEEWTGDLRLIQVHDIYN
jgi:hypothetical protein